MIYYMSCMGKERKSHLIRFVRYTYRRSTCTPQWTYRIRRCWSTQSYHGCPYWETSNWEILCWRWRLRWDMTSRSSPGWMCSLARMQYLSMIHSRRSKSRCCCSSYIHLKICSKREEEEKKKKKVNNKKEVIFKKYRKWRSHCQSYRYYCNHSAASSLYRQDSRIQMYFAGHKRTHRTPHRG
jgi:hypothetical protein